MPLKESDVFQSLSSICSFFYRKKVERGGGAWHYAPPKYTSAGDERAFPYSV